MNAIVIKIIRLNFLHGLAAFGLIGCGGSATEQASINPFEPLTIGQEPVSASNDAPVITLRGGEVVTLAMGSKFVDPGVVGMDPEEGDISYRVHVDSSVIDSTQLGRYEIHYHVKDRQGLQSAPISRVVEVVMPQPSLAEAAARFLTQSTFGPTLADIKDLQSTSYENWLDQQFAAPATLQRPQLETIIGQADYMQVVDQNSSQYRLIRGDIWWDTLVNGEDQLRQRVAFALSQILVISEKDPGLSKWVRGVADYHDQLIQHAFGNYRDLLEVVTLHPMMGDYLSMRRNEKGNAEGTRFPDENYAREVMQLFALGLDQLNLDGTLKLDQYGQPIPTYHAEDVRQLARVFTGWNYSNLTDFNSNELTLEGEVSPMRAFADYHDTGAKVIVGNVEIPAGLTPEQDLKMALDIIFQHPNVAPFISKQLIQKLVTSNPSPQYVERVASIFEDNGEGERGDLKAVVQAILTDYEALYGHRDMPQTYGKVKEPLLKLSHYLRALAATSDTGLLRYDTVSQDFGQHILAANSVFNFFKPDYSPSGRLQQQGLVAPEFEIIDEEKLVAAQNRVYLLLYGKQTDIRFDFDPLVAELSKSPDAYIDRLNNVFFAGAMSEGFQQILHDYIDERLNAGSGSTEALSSLVRNTLFITFLSPEYALQR